jgi:hypothetical protein
MSEDKLFLMGGQSGANSIEEQKQRLMRKELSKRLMCLAIPH